MSRSDDVREHVREALTEPLAGSGFDVEAVELTPAGKRRMLRVAVDSDEGVTLDDIADVTRVVGEILDDSDVMGEQPYTLEVTSRGVDRPLTLPRHWRRNVGRLVTVTTDDGESLTGRITDSDEQGAEVSDASGATRRLAYDTVATAQVQIEFNPPKDADGATAAVRERREKES